MVATSLQATNLPVGAAISLETSSLPGGSLRLSAVGVPLPESKFTSINVTTGTLAAGNLTGANHVALTSTNATPGAQTVRTAAQMFADTPTAVVGQTWRLRIINAGAGTFTLTADGGATVTLTGHVAILTNTWVDYHCVFTSATAATFQSIGAGTQP